jgi:hypothetical protein
MAALSSAVCASCEWLQYGLTRPATSYQLNVVTGIKSAGLHETVDIPIILELSCF